MAIGRPSGQIGGMVSAINTYPLITTPLWKECGAFYTRHFGMAVVFEANWIVMLSRPRDDAISLGFMSPDHPSRPPGPEPFAGTGMIVTVEVADAADAFARLSEGGAPIIYNLHREAWGQNRFMVRDPAGTLVDVVEQTEPASGFWEKYLE
jgi:catechol 2,3-dioxygenase-like lactoylglutathione lyase family enzyme